MIEERIGGRPVYAGRVVSLRVDEVRLPDGRTATREVVEHPGAVAIAALDDDGRLVLVSQYRYPVGRELWEVPAGKLEAGEDPAAAAARELAEETGLAAARLEPLGSFYTSPGFCDELMHAYTARGLGPAGGAAAPDRDEFLRVRRVPLAEVHRWVREGRIADGKTLATLALLEGRLAP